MKEVFLDIPGYEGLYQISNLGNVKSIRTGKLLKPAKDTSGYLLVWLYKNNNRKTIGVHRLVAMTFIPNPQNLPLVNHKDENKTNNAVNNLEWCDCKYNINYGTRTQRSALSNRKRILQFNKAGVFLREWSGVSIASKALFINTSSISQCCQGERKSAGGYIWKYKN